MNVDIVRALREVSTKVVTSACLLVAAAPALAMDFTVSGRVVLASGEIQDGDAAKFSSIVAMLPDDGFGAPDTTVSLASPGGSLLEGMRLGVAIREAGVPTLVAHGNT